MGRQPRGSISQMRRCRVRPCATADRKPIPSDRVEAVVWTRFTVEARSSWTAERKAPGRVEFAQQFTTRGALQ
jgi:hypothetical protein